MDNKYAAAYKFSDKVDPEASTHPAKTYDGNATQNASDEAENVVVVKPTKTEDKRPQATQSTTTTKEAKGEPHQQHANSDQGRGGREGGQSFKDIIVSTDKEKATSSLASRAEPSDSYVGYNRILVPHDGSDTSDKALNHAIYLSKMCGAEIVILHVVEHMQNMNSSAVTATSKEEGDLKKDSEKSNRGEEFDITIEGEVKHMIEEKMRFCKQAGVKDQLSYKIQTGKPVEEIVRSAEDMNVDLIVMASSRSSSLAKRILGSTSRKVLDSVKKPALIVHV
jgi:nucleotide-binding universal stress UspA family protein